MNEGYLKIGSEADRIAIASLLFKHGYEVKTVRRKKNGKTYEYYVKYKLASTDIEMEGADEG